MNSMEKADALQSACGRADETVGSRRLSLLFDQDSFLPVDRFSESAQQPAEAAAGYGTVGGCPVFAFAQNSDQCGGAMSHAQARKLIKLYDMAAKNGAPVVGIYDSMGSRVQEGAGLLNDYGEVMYRAHALSGVVPQISLVLGPCIGASALFASCADFIVMSQEGELTISADGIGGSAKEAVFAGIAAVTAENEEAAVEAVQNLVQKLPSNNLDSVACCDENDAAGVPEAGNSAQEAAKAVANRGSLLELTPYFGKAAYTALASVGPGTSAGVLAYDGTLDADACTKAARFVSFCDAFSLPIVSFVNADRFCSLRAANVLSDRYAQATAAKITVLVGKAYGPVYLAFSGQGVNADYTIAWSQAVVSLLAPEAGAVFFRQEQLAASKNPVADRKQLIEDYACTEGSPLRAAALGLVQDVVKPEDTREELICALGMLSAKRERPIPKKHSNVQL
ncbi:MAG: carboxyl transferase domain-containing protein [Oscillospiraceae bacterium]|nr:carboxyl transferase domain-containing protein [Oscillospiraceae bacterium]